MATIKTVTNNLFPLKAFIQENPKMKITNTFSLVFISLLLLSIFTAFSTIEARKHHSKMHKIKKKHKHANQNNPPLPNPSPVYNIFSFGAKADGVSDDSKVKLNIHITLNHDNV